MLKYHAEEITELYLGRAMTAEDRDEVVWLAKVRNPQMAVFQVTGDLMAKLTFNRI